MSNPTVLFSAPILDHNVLPSAVNVYVQFSSGTLCYLGRTHRTYLRDENDTVWILDSGLSGIFEEDSSDPVLADDLVQMMTEIEVLVVNKDWSQGDFSNV